MSFMSIVVGAYALKANPITIFRLRLLFTNLMHFKFPKRRNVDLVMINIP